MAPQNYVQQLASALGLNSTVATTDFESLIELNRRQQQQQLNMSNVRGGKQQTIKMLKLTTFVENLSLSLAFVHTHLMNEHSLLLILIPSLTYLPASLFYVIYL